MSALQPLARPAGSTQVLRFRGTVDSSVALAVYPKENGTFSTDKIGGTAICVARFAFGDTSDLTDTTTRLPEVCFDDATPAGAHPVTPTQSGVAASATEILNATDDNVSSDTWAQNVYITITPLTGADALLLLSVNPGLTRFCLDNSTTSGLGLASGLRVAVLAFEVGAQIPAGIDLDVLIEVRHSASR